MHRAESVRVETHAEATREYETIPSPAPIPKENPSKALHEIFRKDALKELCTAMGAPIRPVGVTTSIITAFIVLVLASVLLFLATARYSRKETVSGEVTPTHGSFKMVSQITGTVAQVLVTEGQAVKAGETLISVSADPVLASGATLINSLKAIQTNQRRAQTLQAHARTEQIRRQIEELSARRTGLSLDITRLHDSILLLEERKALQAKTSDAHQKLAAKGMVSPAFIRQLEDGLIAVRQQIQHARREIDLQKSQQAQVEAQIGRLHADADIAASEATAIKAQLEERELNFEAAHSGRLVAPIDGVVTAVRIRAGAAVTSGQQLAVVIPSGAATANLALEVELWAPSRAVGFVRPGATVRVMYDAFPYQTFGVGLGTVKEISGTPFAVAQTNTTGANGEQLFRIRVVLAKSVVVANGRDWPLVPGMRLTADLILEEQSLFDWILGPLRAVSKRAS